MIIEWHCETGFANCGIEDTVEVDDDATDEEIDEIVQEEVFNYISWGWERKD